MNTKAGEIVSFPLTVKKGELFEISVLVRHDMESGFRHDEHGRRIARNIIREFTCKYNDVEIFKAVIHPGISANPYFLFSCRAVDSGTLEFWWIGDNHFSRLSKHQLLVSKP